MRTFYLILNKKKREKFYSPPIFTYFNCQANVKLQNPSHLLLHFQQKRHYYYILLP